MNDSALSQKDHNMSTAGRVTANFAELMGNKDMIMHVGLNAYNSNYEINTATSSNSSGTEETKTRGTVFSFASGGRGLANAYRMQIAGQEPGTVYLGSAGTSAGYNVVSPNTSSVHSDNIGIEGILAYNSIKFQGEYSQAYYEATDRGAYYGSAASGIAGSKMQADVDTWYAEVLWLVSGEKYADFYKKGAFGSIKPKSEFNMDTGSGYGAWELGFRVDAFDVSNTSSVGSKNSRFQGTGGYATANAFKDECAGDKYGVMTTGGCNGGAKSYTAGVKWVMNPNMLIKGSYTYTDFDDAFYPVDVGTKDTATINGGAVRSAANLKKIDHEDLLMIRGQWMF